MSTQTNQYLMWGILLPYKWHEQWEKENKKPDGFYDTFEDFMDDSAFEIKVKHKDGIFCLFDGRDGRFIIIGRVLAKAKDGDMIGDSRPFAIPDIGPDREAIVQSVIRNFGPVKGEFQYYFVTVYR